MSNPALIPAESAAHAKPIALVYRVTKSGNRCGRQYPFFTVDEFAKWCSRKPYCNELLLVIVIVDSREVERDYVQAESAVKYLKGFYPDKTASAKIFLGEADLKLIRQFDALNRMDKKGDIEKLEEWAGLDRQVDMLCGLKVVCALRLAGVI